jgi:hypothetical protein
MDWRSGSRQNTTGSAFRGINSRNRGRGRGRSVPLNTRGGHIGSQSPAVAPAAALLPPPPPPRSPPPMTQPTSGPLINPPPPTKPPSHRVSLQPPRRPSSLSNLDTSKASLAHPATLTPTPGGRPQEGRRASHNPPNVSISPASSLKLDSSAPTTPGSPRPKPSRRRSHNRTRSSSKASTTQQVSATPSVSSLRDKNKEALPHMASASASPHVQSFDLRTNIDTLVERVRAMAMAGSAIDKDKDKEAIHTQHDGHIDWAGDEDDTLPDLDDWVKPKHSQNKEVEHAEAEHAELESVSEQQYLLPVEETADPNPTSQHQDMQRTSGLNGQMPAKNDLQSQESKDIKTPKTANDTSNDVGVGPGRAKSRGKYGRKKSIISDANILTPVSQVSAGSEAKPSDPLGPTRPHPPLVHPLPPKPQISPPPMRGPRSRGPTHGVQPMARTKDTIPSEASSATPSRKEAFVESQSTQAVKPIVETASEATVADPWVRKKGFDPTVDWANAPRPTQNSDLESVREASEATSSSIGAHPDTHTRKRAFDPSVDWSKVPAAPDPSPSRRSSPVATHSPIPSGRISSPPSFTYPHAALSYDRSRSPFPHPNFSPRLSSARASPRPSNHTRSQMNSPERSPRLRQDKEGLTHLRAHSSPQTGPGTRTHTSRPVITPDALSRITRTLGVPGTTTPPRGPTVEVAVAD